MIVVRCRPKTLLDRIHFVPKFNDFEWNRKCVKEKALADAGSTAIFAKQLSWDASFSVNPERSTNGTSCSVVFNIKLMLEIVANQTGHQS